MVPSPQTTIRQAARLRQDSAAFEDWHSALRTLAREARHDTAEELRERVEDTFQPHVRQIERELKKSGSAAAAGHALTDFIVLGTIGGLSAAVTSDHPATVPAAVAAAAATGVVDWVRRAYKRPSLEGADAVLASLIRQK